MPLVPAAGHYDMMQFIRHFLHELVALNCVRIDRETEFVQSLDLVIDDI